VQINVLQGERTRAVDNRSLGTFHLVGIPPAPRGVPQIEVTFDIDANGILNVTAKDLATGKQQAITITGSGNLTREEIDRMVAEAQRHAEEDRRAKELAEVRNSADSLLYGVERNLRELGDSIDANDKTRIEEKVANLRKIMDGGDIEAIRSAYKELEHEQHLLAQKLYERASKAETPTAEESTVGAAAGDGEVIDAEFKEEQSSS